MAKVKRELIFATFVTSGLAMIASFIALGTQNWTSAEINFDEGITSMRQSKVNYGLFSGLYERNLNSILSYDVLMTCSISDNKCALLCDNTADSRSAVLTALINKETSRFSCTGRSLIIYNRPSSRADTDGERTFLNAGLYISTIVFLVLSCVAGLGATVLAMWNTVYNPVEVYFNILGLFVWNCVAMFFSLLTMVMWGVLYTTVLIDNIGVYDTITEDAMTVNAILDYSYWLNLVSFVLYIASAVIIGVRQYLISKEPVVSHNIDDNADPGLLIY